MNVDVGIWSRLTRLILVLLVLAGLGGVGVWYFPLIRKNEAMRKQMLDLEGKIKTEEEKSRQLESSIKALRNDPKAVERLAREKLRYAKPGETIILFEPGTTNASLGPAQK